MSQKNGFETKTLFLTAPKASFAFYNQLKQIFFLTSSVQIFSSELEKEKFFKKWTDYYFEYFPHEIFLAFQKEQLSAYLTGCSNSLEACDFYDKINPSYLLFKDLFDEYPAHLHMNTHPESIGKGLGSQLIDRYVSYLKENSVSGLHIITSPLSRNTNFYTKNGFEKIAIRQWKGSDLLLMGLKL